MQNRTNSKVHPDKGDHQRRPSQGLDARVMKRPATLQGGEIQGTILRTTTQRRTPIRGLTLQWAPLWTGLLVVCLSMAPVCSQLTQEDEERLLELHNQLRGQVEPSAANMLAMRWDEKLRILAESYVVKCIWDHNPDLEDTGENLYIFEGQLDLEHALNKWFIEHQSYNYATTECEEEKMCGHYTQMVWAQSSAVGCAAHVCDTMEGLDFKKSTFLVCNYFPAGNYHNVQPYVEGPPCSNCPSGFPGCLNRLCVPDVETTDEPIPWEEPTSDSPDSPVAESPVPTQEPDLSLPSGPPPTQEDREQPGTETTEAHVDWVKKRAQEMEKNEIDTSSAGTSTKPAFVMIAVVVLLSMGL